MEVSGAVLLRSPNSSSAVLRRGSGEPYVLCQWRSVLSMRPRGFSDEGHLKYYIPPLRCGAKTEEEKKRAKLVKGLSKNLSAFYSMGFGVENGEGMMGEFNGKMMKEAAELLLSQLKQLKAEEKELKRRRKQEKKAMKVARMKGCADDSSSSSSSSESSDSESETVVKLSTLRAADTMEPRGPAIRVVPTETSVCSQALLPLELEPEAKIEEKLPNTPIHCCGRSGVGPAKAMDKIEVCMGGKCKKSGAMELLSELEKGVDMEGAVVGCKCMGRCKDGPNVRVVKHSSAGEDPVKPNRNPLCIGVGLEDVSSIVSNFLEGFKDADLLPA